MIRHLLFIASIGVFLCAGASPLSPQRNLSERSVVKGDKNIKGSTVVNGKNFRMGGFSGNLLRSPGKVAPTTPVITTAPGKVQEYLKESGGYYTSGGRIGAYMDYSQSSQIVWDGDDAYFYNILSYGETDSYVKGTREGDEIILPMNQTVVAFNDEEYDLNFGLLRPVITLAPDPDYDEDDEPSSVAYINFEYSDDYANVTFTVNEDGRISLVIPEQKYTIGTDEEDPAAYGFPPYAIGYYYTDDYMWAGYCDLYQFYDEFNYELVTMPEGVTINTFSYVNEEVGRGIIVDVARQDDYIYIRGLSPFAPDACLKAIVTDNGTKAHVPQNQYIGSYMGYYYVLTATAQKSGRDYVLAPSDVDFVFLIESDEETGKILSLSSANPEYALAFNTDPYELLAIDLFENLILKSQDSFAGTPCTPTHVDYYEYGDWLGANFLFFRLSPFADNGDVIDVSKLYYTIFLDGEPYAFEQHEGLDLNDDPKIIYPGIEKETTLVPYLFGNGIDLYEDDGGTFIVGLYVEGISSIGVEAVYIYEDQPTFSDLVTVDAVTGETTITPGSDAKVEEINSSDIISIEFYDLNGYKISDPAKGVFIMRAILSDGRVITRKLRK